jgi:hypothetical protein
MSDDPSYYAARAAEERRLAMASADKRVRRVHLEMAAKYAALAGANVTYTDESPSEPQQKTG